MFNTSLDILYISLAVSAILLTIFICVNLVFSVLILRDVSKATEKVRDASEKIHGYVVAPIKNISAFVENITAIVSALQNRFGGKEDKKD